MLPLQSWVSATAVSQWHEGCLCELKQTAAAATSDLAMPAIFGTSFFKQSGRVSQFCPCSIETVQRLNSELIMPRLLPLLNRTFFRYVKLDLERPCPFWDDSGNGSCQLRDCAVEVCSEDEEARLQQCGEEQALGLGEVQRTDAEALGAAAPSWDLSPTSCATSSTCWTEELTDEQGTYVDLVDNPEQYTGYSASAGASRLWEEWHSYNNLLLPPGCAKGGPDEVPVELRLFSRLTSGVHASVSSHIAANYLLDRHSGTWGLEIDEYERRLGARPERLNNLHFAYLTVLRALELAATHLSHSFAFSTGMPREDALVARQVRELLSSHPEWPLTFDEQRAFVGVRCPSTLAAAADATCGAHEVSMRTELLDEMRSRLRNVSRLMDCVGCGRCRLWGKLQVQGLGTALRILYAPDRQSVLHSLRRSHVVALFNLLGRLSHSVEVARVVVPLLGAAHSTCSPRGCKASEYVVFDTEDDEP